jgi:hypothetical protein
MKDMTKMAQTMAEDGEEGADNTKAKPADAVNSSADPTAVHSVPTDGAAPQATTTAAAPTAAAPTADAAEPAAVSTPEPPTGLSSALVTPSATTPAASTSVSPVGTPGGSPPPGGARPDAKAEARRRAAEARAKAAATRAKEAEQDAERRAAMETRVVKLTQLLIDRLRPFVDAAAPGSAGDAETEAWAGRMRREADDLKLESFGVELLHTIGGVYGMKANGYLKSKKFLGLSVA